MTQILLILFFLAMGMVLRYRGPFGEGQDGEKRKAQTVVRLNQLIIYLPLPAIVLSQVPFLQLSKNLLLPIMTPWLLLLPMIAVVTLLRKVFNWNRNQYACLLVCCTLGNTAYLGYPMVSVLLGEQALAIAIIYDQLGNFLMLAIFSNVVIAWAKTSEQLQLAANGLPLKTLSLNILCRIFSFPPFLCLLLALWLPPESLNETILMLLSAIGSLLMPMAMVSIGMQLDLKPAAKTLKPLLIGLSAKMLIMPGLVFVAMLFSDTWQLEHKTILLQSAMPTSVAAGALVTAAGLAPRLCAAMVAYGMLASLVILPLWVALMNVFVN